SPTTGVVPTVELKTPPLPVSPPPPAAVRRDPPLLSSHPATSVWLRSAPGNSSQHGIALGEAHAGDVAESSVAANPSPAATPPLPSAPLVRKPADPATPPAARNGNGNFSISRQLGLSVSRIVIDPGHGGHDPGAQSRGVVEAELTLDVALRLEK